MFEYQPRRHPLQTSQFWFVIILCASGVVLWRSGEFSQGQQAEQVSVEIYEDELPPPPQVNIAEGESHRESADEKQRPFNESRPRAPQQQEQQAAIEGPPVGSLLTPPPVPGLLNMPQELRPVRSVEMTREGDQQHSVQNGNPIQLISATIDPTQGTGLFTADRAIERLGRGEGTSEASRQPSQILEEPRTTSSSESTRSSGFDFTEVDDLMSRGEDVAALRQLSTWYWQYPEQRRSLQSRLNQLSRRIYFQPYPHYMPPHEVDFGDRLEKIAKNYHVSWEYLAKINRVEPQKIRGGQKLKVIQGPFSVVVDTKNYELTVHAHGYYVTRMPVGIGKDGSTPIGTFRVVDKVSDPVYYGPDGVIKNDDPNNPLGEYWLAISDDAGTLQGYGIHGTIEPETIGKAASRGCIRLHDQDIADLYDLLTIGSEVVIRR